MFFKIAVLKILQYSQENTCAGVAALKAFKFIIKRRQYRRFPVSVAKFLRTAFLQGISGGSCYEK